MHGTWASFNIGTKEKQTSPSLGSAVLLGHYVAVLSQWSSFWANSLHFSQIQLTCKTVVQATKRRFLLPTKSSLFNKIASLWQLKQRDLVSAGSECHFSSLVWLYIFSSFSFLLSTLQNSSLVFACLIKSILCFIVGGCGRWRIWGRGYRGCEMHRLCVSTNSPSVESSVVSSNVLKIRLNILGVQDDFLLQSMVPI